jgi:hypothetical protein
LLNAEKISSNEAVEREPVGIDAGRQGQSRADHEPAITATGVDGVEGDPHG